MYLCEALAFWALHECNIRIGSVEVGLGIRGIAGDIRGGLVLRGKGDGWRLWRDISGTRKRVHEGGGEPHGCSCGGRGGKRVEEEEEEEEAGQILKGGRMERAV